MITDNTLEEVKKEQAMAQAMKAELSEKKYFDVSEHKPDQTDENIVQEETRTYYQRICKQPRRFKVKCVDENIHTI